MTDQQDKQPGREVELRQDAREVARLDTDSWSQMAGPIFKLAAEIANTEFVPRGLRGKAPAAAAAMLYGREVGLPPMTALNSTHVIDGSPSISAEMMRAMILAEGHELEFAETNGSRCIVRGRRRGSSGSWTTVEWTLDMARAAGLLGKDNWKHYPRRMLQARASAELCELVFPDVIHGFKAAEELQDASDGDGPEEAAPATEAVQRAGGARKRAAAKKAAPPPQAGPDEVPLPDELGDSPAAPGQAAEETGAEPEPEAPSPAPGPEDDGDSTSSGGSGADEGGPEEAAPQPADSGSPAHTDDSEEATSTPASSEPDEDGAVDAEVVGDGPPPESRKASQAQVRKLTMNFGRFAFEGTTSEQRDRRLAITSALIGRTVESTNDLTVDEASGVIDTLSRMKDLPALEALVQGVRDAESGS